jgi:uncharacterized protein YndB with AHSA1/START domain
MKASATIDIDRPRDDVFAYVADVEQMEHWVVGVGETALVEGDGTGVGDRYETTYSYGGRDTEMAFVVTEYDPPTRFGITAPEGPFAFDGLLELEDVGDATRVTNTIDAGSDGTFTTVMFTVFRPVVRWLMARRLKQELVELKAQVEGDAGATDESKRPHAPDA